MVVVTRTCKEGQSSMVEGGLMARFGRWAGWGAGILAVAALAIYVLGPVSYVPGMRLGGRESAPPASWAAINDHDEIRIETNGALPWVVRAWYAGTDDGLYVFAWREARWWRRIEATPDARVRIGDATFSVRAVPVEAKSENDAVASAYLEKYGHFTDAEQHGRAMAESAQELFDDARRGSVYQLLRLEPVP
jgi:hypothetical protein